MPGTPEGRSPYDPALMQDAFNKADNAQSPYFFTWNVNTFVLFDRSKWQVPMIERRIRDWDLGLNLTSPTDCGRPEVQRNIREKFLPAFFQEFAAIVRGEIKEWGMPPDDVFIRSLESHLEWPVIHTRDYLLTQCQQDKVFAAKLQDWMSEQMQWTFDPHHTENWRAILHRTASTLCYVFCNRAIFYEAIRSRYPQNLSELNMPRGKKNHTQIYDFFCEHFLKAVKVTGDYEPIFYPQVSDWAGSLVFASDQARHGWSGVFVNLAEYNFREIAYDIVGGIFQKLIAPEERQKFGQFFTNEDIVDIINAFCLRRAGDTVLDPACGSGSFLVRAYYRKSWLSEQKTGGRRHQDHQKFHQDLLREIFGCDIAVFAAHLATLNLASRQIKDEENYPYITRSNFFEIPDRREAFCRIPSLTISTKNSNKKDLLDIALPDLDAVVGNPPYVRQEHITKRNEIKRSPQEDKTSHESRLKNTKEHMQELCSAAWPGLKLSGRSDLHCYFWPVAAQMLKEGGYFGFLTSSSWLDVEYGFALQGWILQNFKIIAIVESLDEPWFEDARVKTAITIMQRCRDEKSRNENVVKFVRLQKPVREILGLRPHGDESARQNAAEKFRQLILKTKKHYADSQLRIIPVSQSQLWREGVAAGLLLSPSRSESAEIPDDPDTPDRDYDSQPDMSEIAHTYAAGKWGRFLRAPDLYFRLMEKYGDRFVKLGEIAEIKFGIKSGCDAFFMPRDVTGEILQKLSQGLPWNDVGLMKSCKLAEVENGAVKIIRAGDNTLHPIEAEFLRPEVHSLMQVDRPVIRARDLNRVVLWVRQPLKDLTGTYVAKYIRWGARQTFASKKSKAVPVPQRSTCAARPVWYNLTNITSGTVFWPMAQKYRHIIPANPEHLVCNHNLFYIRPFDQNGIDLFDFSAALNSTIVSLIKHFYGRYAGSEGTLKTEVIDVLLLPIPNPQSISKKVSDKLHRSLETMSQRKITHLVDNAMLNCHSEEHMRQLLQQPFDLPDELRHDDRRLLDEAIFELLGVKTKKERDTLIDKLYHITTQYYRYQRTQDIQAMEDRAGVGRRRLGPLDLAASIWDSLVPTEKLPPLTEWLKTLPGNLETCHIPDGKAQALGADHMFDPTAVVFKTNQDHQQINYSTVEQAALIVKLADLDIRGKVNIPRDAPDCNLWLQQINDRITHAQTRFNSLSASRTGNTRLQEQVANLLLQWFIHGRS